MNKLLFYIVVISHHILAPLLVISTILGSIYQPWYVGLMFWVVLVRIMTSRDRCVLTDLEKYVRLKLRMKEMNGGFVKHYYVYPLKSLLKALRATNRDKELP